MVQTAEPLTAETAAYIDIYCDLNVLRNLRLNMPETIASGCPWCLEEDNWRMYIEATSVVEMTFFLMSLTEHRWISVIAYHEIHPGDDTSHLEQFDWSEVFEFY